MSGESARDEAAHIKKNSILIPGCSLLIQPDACLILTLLNMGLLSSTFEKKLM